MPTAMSAPRATPSRLTDLSPSTTATCRTRCPMRACPSGRCEAEEPASGDRDDALGVDLGVVNIVTDSDGEIHSGRAINNVRARHRRLRTQHQTKGTKKPTPPPQLPPGQGKRIAR